MNKIKYRNVKWMSVIKLSMAKFDLDSFRVVTMRDLEDWVVDVILILFGGYS
jgi:hypothetical protein